MIQRINNKQKGLKFDGVDDWVSVPNIDALSFTNTDVFSIYTVFNANNFNPTNSTHPRLFSKVTPTPYNGYTVFVSGISIGIIFYNTNSTIVFRTIFTFLNNVTYNLVIVKRTGLNVSDVDIYINGTLYTTDVLGGIASFTSPSNISIGKFTQSTNEGQFNGIISDIKIFNKSLSQSEVTDLNNKTSIPSNCIADYRFGNRQGTVLVDYVSGNNGTLTNYTIAETSIGNTNKWVYDCGSDPFDNKRKTGVIPQKGLRFDGVNDYIQTNFSHNFTNDFSISVRYKLGAKSTKTLFAIGTGGVNRIQVENFGGDLTKWCILFSSSNNVQFFLNQTLNTVVSLLTLVKNDNLWSFYADGNFINSFTYAYTNTLSTLKFATDSAISDFLDGNIYDCKIYNRAISGGEVTQLLNGIPVTSGLVADYRFDNQSGTTLTDYASGNNGTLTNYTTQDVSVGSTNKWLYEDGLAFDDTRNGGIVSTNDTLGLLFDGVNEHIETISTINITSQTNTISMLCRLNSISDTVFYVNSESGNGIFAYIQSSQIVIQRGRGGTSGDARFNTSLNTSTVYHFVFVYNSDLTMDLYINGVLQSRASQTLAGSCISNITLKIGKTTVGVPHFNGIIYDFKLFNKSLTQSEILGIYDSRCNQIPISAISNNIVNYSFNQTQGTVLIDTSGFARNANLINYTVAETTPGVGNKWVTGGSPTNNKILRNISHNIGNGLRFDGVNDNVFISAISNSRFNFGVGDFTASLVVKLLTYKPTGNGQIFICYNNNSMYGLYVSNSSGCIWFIRDASGNSININTPMQLNVVYNIVVSRNGTTSNIYVNGVLLANGSNVLLSNINTVNYPIILGGAMTSNPTPSSQANSDYQNMELYDLKIFNKALTQTEVTGLFNSRNNIIPISAIPNVVANYNFNQKQGTTLIDGSGNNLNGTLTNYTTPETTLGVNNKWVDSSGNSILL